MRTKVRHKTWFLSKWLLLAWPDIGERLGFFFSWIFSLPLVELIVAMTISAVLPEIRMRMTSFWVTVQIPCKRPVLPACQEERPELCPTLTHTCWEKKKDGRNLAKQRRSLDKQEHELYAQTCALWAWSHLFLRDLLFSLAHIRRGMLAHLVFLCCFSGTEWTFCLHPTCCTYSRWQMQIMKKCGVHTHCISL